MVENMFDKIHCPTDQEGQQSDMFRARLDRRDTLEQVLFHADVLWLGMDNTLSPATHRRQVLAAQFHYLDDAPIDEIITLLAPPIGDAWLVRSTVEKWLRHEGVIRALAYNEIFFLSILEQQLSLIDRMDNLITRLMPVFGAEQVSRILGTPGLWQRLVFQFRYLEHLAVQDICQRLQAAAQRGGFEITDDRLSVWLHGKLLITHLYRSIVRDTNHDRERTFIA